MAIPITRPYFSENARSNILKGIDEILASGRLMMGEWTTKFENTFAEKVGVSHAVTVNTCTTALMICLQYYGIKDAEVLVPASSFLTDVSSVVWSGGKAVLVDTNPDTLSFDLEDMKRKTTSKTKGIIWVHLTGLISSEHEEILRYARDNNLFVIEDCAHAHGSSINDRQAGTFGDAGCFSFFPTKLISSGTGGMITTSDEKLRLYAEEVRLLGRDVKTAEIVRVGNDWFMDEIRACVGYHQLLELEVQLARRREIAGKYRMGLAGVPGVSLLNIPSGYELSYYQFPVFLERGIDREMMIKTLKQKYGIATKRIYLPLHQEVIFTDYDDGTLKKTEDILNRSLCLPMYYGITDDELEMVMQAFTTELKNLYEA